MATIEQLMRTWRGRLAACQENEPTWLDLVPLERGDSNPHPTVGNVSHVAVEGGRGGVAPAGAGSVGGTLGQREMGEWLEETYGSPSSFEKAPAGTYTDSTAAGR